MADSHQIPLSKAAEMTRAYRTANPESSLCSSYERKAFERLLGQPGCNGIRCYFALTTENTHSSETPGRLTLVMVGVDSDNNDMVDGELAEMGFPCPTVCSTPNELNGLD